MGGAGALKDSDEQWNPLGAIVNVDSSTSRQEDPWTSRCRLQDEEARKRQEKLKLARCKQRPAESTSESRAERL
ncbi:hypothetical protein B0H12DRAFT_1088344 [Mycena haematopus]|nr:hypothetical protein B0H12DRAFT_1088344 [Mycena haematopus]